MPNRTALTAALSVVVSLAAGGAAMAAVTSEAPGSVAGAESATPAAVTAPGGGATATAAPGAVGAVASGPADPGATSSGGGFSKAAAAWFAGVSRLNGSNGAPAADAPDTNGDAPASTPSAPRHGDDPPPTTSQTTAPAPPTTTTTTRPPSCYGSDDGMTEAQKQAREAACQGGDD
ncbi:MAG: hypothetical protein ACXV8T_04235 [Acidimicrobiia bacterium]